MRRLCAVLLVALTLTGCADSQYRDAREVFPGFTFPANVPPECVNPVKIGLNWITVHVNATVTEASVSILVETTQDLEKSTGRFPVVADAVGIPYCASIQYRSGVGAPVSVTVRASIDARTRDDPLTCLIQDKYGNTLNQSVVHGDQQAVCSTRVT